MRRIFLLILFGILMHTKLVAYQWPMELDNDPSNGLDFSNQLAIIGTFGECRSNGSVERSHFSNGIDIYVTEGWLVYAIEGGTAYIDENSINIGKFRYANVKNIKVKNGEAITSGTLIGEVDSHNCLHFMESSSVLSTSGEPNGVIWLNPLRTNGLDNFTDNASPIITDVHIVKHATEEGLDNVVFGQLDILVNAFDPGIQPTGEGIYAVRCGIYKLRIEFKDVNDNLIEEGTIKYHKYDENPKCNITECYASGSNTANYIYKATNNPFETPYLRYWNTRRKKGSTDFTEMAYIPSQAMYPEGAIKIQVIAEDIKGNQTVYQVSQDNFTPLTNDFFIAINDGNSTKQYENGEIAYYLQKDGGILSLDLLDKNGNVLSGVNWEPQNPTRGDYNFSIHEASNNPKGTTIYAEYEGQLTSLHIVTVKAEIEELSFSGNGQYNTSSIYKQITMEEYYDGEEDYSLPVGGGDSVLVYVNYSSPHWKRNKRQYPVCYQRDNFIMITPKLKFKPTTPNLSSIKLKAEANDEMQLIPFDYSISGENTAKTFNKKLENKFYNLNPFTINWFVSENGIDWSVAGTTENKIFVLLNEPMNMPNEVVLNFAYQKLAATNINSTQSFLTEIRNVFETKNITYEHVGNSKLLKYYGNPETGNLRADYLLIAGDGQCTSWQRLMAYTLKAQGVVATELEIISTTNKEQLIVKNWTFTDNPCGTNAIDGVTYPYQNITHTNWEDSTLINNFDENGHYQWLYEEVFEQAGITGQGNDNPIATFINHQVVQVGNDVYDPSYGSIYENDINNSPTTDLKIMQNTSVAAFYFVKSAKLDEDDYNEDLNQDGDMLDEKIDVYQFLIRKPNPNTKELKINTNE